MRSRVPRLVPTLALVALAASVAGSLATPVLATHPSRWPVEQRRELILGRAATGLGRDMLASGLAAALVRERPNDAACWAALAFAQGLGVAWSGGSSTLADEVAAAAGRARDLDRDGDPAVSLAEGVAALVTASRTSDPDERERVLVAAERVLTRVSSDGRANATVRFGADVSRLVLAFERDDALAVAQRLAGAIATARDAQLPPWWTRRLRELVLDRLDALGNSEAALRLADELAHDPSWGRLHEPELALVRARARLALGQPQEALRDLGSVSPALSRGLDVDAWLALGRQETALACARRVRNALGAGHEGDELVGRALLALGRFEEARGAFERATRGPGARCARCCGGLAVALVEGADVTTDELTSDDLARARRLSRRAEETDGEAPEAFLARAALARHDGDPVQANRLEALALAAANPRALAHVRSVRERARAAWARGRWGEAAERATELLAARPGDLDALGLLAHALVPARHPSAGPVLELLADRSPQDAWAHLERGRARLAQGRADEARRDLERALFLLRVTPRAPERGEAQALLWRLP